MPREPMAPYLATIDGSATSTATDDFEDRDITVPDDRPTQLSTGRVPGLMPEFRRSSTMRRNYGPQRRAACRREARVHRDWDSGFVALDQTNPANPRVQGAHGLRPPTRTSTAIRRSTTKRASCSSRGDEDFCKTSGSGIEKGYGYLRVWDYSQAERRRSRSASSGRRTPGGNDQGAGDYTIHNNYLVGMTLYTSWYTDGIRVIDVANPRAPRRSDTSFLRPRTNPVKPSQRGGADEHDAGLGLGRRRGDRPRLRRAT